MSDETNPPIPPEEVQEMLAELGIEITVEQAAELARLLDLTGSVEEALAALQDEERRAA